jgi:hypothetical protein
MAVKFNLKSGSCSSNDACTSKSGCPDGVCPDFFIKRHDTRPAFKVSIADCDGPMDFSGLVIEVNMWALAKLKASIEEDTEYFRLADDIGFNQIMVGDIIVMDQVRMPERMLVVAFDEHNKLVKVQRGYHGTTPAHWHKGQKMRIFRILNAQGTAEMVFDDVENIDGTKDKDVLQESLLVYEWQAEDTCLPGCYWLEFKVLKMIDMVWYLPGGYWSGAVHSQDNGFFYTGSEETDSSVRLSYDQVLDKYFLPSTLWSGDVHLHSDENYYTGSVHNDSSVFLNKTGIPSSEDVSYNEDGLMSLHAISMIPSFTEENLAPYYFNCVLGEGVEWVRRFPSDDSEGFLIKVGFSPTSE